jgi:hypothetical protein
VFAWLVQFGRMIWHLARPARPAPQSEPEPDDDTEALWLITIEPAGGDERPVGILAGTRAMARELANSAVGAYVLQTGEVFLGRTGVMEIELHDEATLRAALATAVPLWIGNFRARPTEVAARAARVLGVITEQSAALVAATTKADKAKAFVLLSEAVAIHAFAPGGATVCGLHFDASVN